ncbi:MAG: PIN domain-containing protein [Nitrospirae bacterium]|nr:PIN domain-containing protein [Nitrospirota bacterium]
MKRIFVDTGAWYALVDRNDPVHGLAAEFLRANTIPLITTNFILDEAVTLINKRLGWKIASDVGGRLRDGLAASLTAVGDKDEDAAWAIFLKYREAGFSYTDCTSFAVMKRFGLDTAFTFDAHFAAMNFNVVPKR